MGKVARDICGGFSFDLAMLFDKGKLDSTGESYRRCVTFTSDDPKFYVRPANIDYHEYAFGTTEELFEPQPPGPGSRLDGLNVARQVLM